MYSIISTEDNIKILNDFFSGLNCVNVEELESFDPIPGHRYLVIGDRSYSRIVKEFGIHLGPRSEHYGDIKRMSYLIIKNGAIFKFCELPYTEVTRWIGKDAYDKYINNPDEFNKKYKRGRLAAGVSKKTGRAWHRLNFMEFDQNSLPLRFLTEDLEKFPKMKSNKIIRDLVDIENSLNYFTNLPVGTRFGLDYETNDFPFDSPDFYTMGVSIVTEEGHGAYYDMEWIDTESSYYDRFLEMFKKFLDKHQAQIYTYNVGFEMRVSYLLTQTLYDFQDSSTINLLTGDNYKRFSLKYTAMNHLKVPSWDDDFDYLTDRLHHLFFGIKYPKSEDYILEPTPRDSYESSEIYQEIVNKYPEDKSEFKRLIDKYWGYPYKCIPSTILGKYCSLDSFYTVKLRGASDKMYSEIAWETFSDNIRLGASLEIFGWFKDQEICEEYSTQAAWYIAYGNVNCVLSVLDRQLSSYENISGYQEFDDILKFGINPLHSKSLLTRYLNEDWESGLDETRMESELGYRFYSLIMSTLTKHNVLKFTRPHLRKRNIFKFFDEDIKEYWNFIENEDHTFSVKDVEYPIKFSDSIEYNIKKYQYSYLKDLSSKMKLQDHKESIIDNKGEEVTTGFIIDYCKGVFNLQSPNLVPLFLNDSFVKYAQVIKHLRTEDSVPDLLTESESFYEDLDKSIDKFEEEEKWLKEFFYEYGEIIRNLDTEKYSQYCSHGYLVAYLYDIKMLIYDCPLIPKNKLDEFGIKMSHWEFFLNRSHGSWYLKSAGPMGHLNSESREYVFQNIDKFDITNRDYKSLIKFNICYLLLRKYTKSHGTYLTGMMSDFDRGANKPDKNLISTERFLPREQGEVIKSHVRYNVCQKKSKRWSAPIHTIPPNDQSKRVITTPPGHLLSYFDINH